MGSFFNELYFRRDIRDKILVQGTGGVAQNPVRGKLTVAPTELKHTVQCTALFGCNELN